MLNKKEIKVLLQETERELDELKKEDFWGGYEIAQRAKLESAVNLYEKMLFMSEDHARELLQLNRNHDIFIGRNTSYPTKRLLIYLKKLEAETEALEKVLEEK